MKPKIIFKLNFVLVLFFLLSCNAIDTDYKKSPLQEKTSLDEKAMLRSLFRTNGALKQLPSAVRKYSVSKKESTRFYYEFLDTKTKNHIRTNRIEYLKKAYFPPLKGVANVDNWEEIKNSKVNKSDQFQKIAPLVESINEAYKGILICHQEEIKTPKDYVINKFKIHLDLAYYLYFWTDFAQDSKKILSANSELEKMNDLIKKEVSKLIFDTEETFKQLFLGNDAYMTDLFALLHEKDFDSIYFDAIQKDFSLEYQNRYYYAELEKELEKIMTEVSFQQKKYDALCFFSY